MDVIHTVHKDGAVKVPVGLLKAAGLKPGVPVSIQVINGSLVLERTSTPRASQRLEILRRVHGRFKHIDWKTPRAGIVSCGTPPDPRRRPTKNIVLSQP